MADDTQWLADAKARLAAPHASKRRKGSIAEKVEALRPEIEAARAAGKTWKRIAIDVSFGEELNADAVRIAFARSQGDKMSAVWVNEHGSEPAAPPETIDASKLVDPTGSVHSAESVDPVYASKSADDPIQTTLPDEGLLGDMFAPMFDARDTRGRGCDEAPSEEGRP